MTIEYKTGETLVIETAAGKFVGKIVGPARYPGEWVFTPTNQAGEEMPKKRTAEGVRELITVFEDTAATVAEQLANLRKELALLETPAPPPASRLTVSVKFWSSPYVYRYLILHVPGKGYYTTGSMDENKYFATWEDMLAYFNKDDVERRSAFSVLTLSSQSYGGVMGGGVS